jgi:hypothetical protein
MAKKAIKRATTRQTNHIWFEVKRKASSDAPSDSLARQIARLWDRYRAGNDQALLDLIIWSLSGGRLPPVDAITAFVARYDRWRAEEVRTLDEAFKVQRQKGVHIRGGRFTRGRLRPYIAVRAAELHKGENMPIDRGLFETIAVELKIGTSTVEKIYYEPETRVWHEMAATGLLRLGPPKMENS